MDAGLVRRVSERLREKLTDTTLGLWTQAEVEALIESIALDERRLLRLCLTRMRDLMKSGAASHQVSVAGIPNLLKQLPSGEVAGLTEFLVPEVLNRLSAGPEAESEVLIGSEMLLPMLRPFASVRTLSDPSQGVRCVTVLIGPRRSPYATALAIARLGRHWAGVV